ncbi:Putative uncharacterized protein [Mycoavidus cysteinexigens]|uniref:Uncharacterized protein n=1 Tax=Mycoavidus cysteinexigens TaxID=1553431 RepID=A0A2Z6ETL6_9BURK|nr:EscE/YscE/SsaE family type III secretion system needle protein co-chaperone [Mycoavidus cysteinexigens]BBE08773.1 Putative uncharacterized protein [Mycoavidus cysteinexigens]GAM52513.1 hypothetical protein EBME_0976 [bacterium endosymbiont of Mortierella elongata FMR23-6]GLR01595.1 hypothetical protein GCM10007934_14070 [Mycoavidus cysteinexigens]
MRLTTLEDVLHDDASGLFRDQALAKLRTAEQHLRAQLRMPQIPAEHAALQRCVTACASAAQVIDTLWRRYHGFA